MKERPIIFSGPMVNAIIDGRKTQTRRVVKPQPKNVSGPNFDGLWSETLDPVVRYFGCHYGQPGGRLWVKETFCQFDAYGTPWLYRADEDEDGSVPFLMHGEGGSGGGVANTVIERWKPSIFMPRRASRILLEITAIRVERLQEISNEDAKAEGIEAHDDDGVTYYGPYGRGNCCPIAAYRDLWESINGQGSWDANPWVWVIEFKVLEGGKR